MLPLGDSNQGPVVQHACITAHDTCLWHVGRLSNIPQTNYWVAPLVLINKLNNLMEIDCHLLVVFIYQLKCFIPQLTFSLAMCFVHDWT